MSLRKKSLIGLVYICLAFFPLSEIAMGSSPDAWDLVAQNEAAALYIHPQTTEIAVKDLRSGKMWFSNPQDRSPQRSVGHELVVIRYDAPAAPDRQMNSFDHSVKYGQFEISPLPNGVRVEYLFGQEYEAGQIGLPQMIRADRFEELILSRIVDVRTRSSLERYYTLVALEEPSEAEEVDSKEVQALEKQLFGEYILVSHGEDYQLLKQEISALQARLTAGEDSQDVRERLRKARSSMEKMRSDLVYGLLEKFTGYSIGGLETRTEGYRHDVEKPSDLSSADFQHLIGNPTYLLGKVPPFIEKQLAEALLDMGYGVDALTYDHLKNRLDPPLANQVVFRIPIEYSLSGSDLIVRIPVGEIEYPKTVFTDYTINFAATPGEDFVTYDEAGGKESYPLTSIGLMRFFGAGNGSQEGYLFVPDGCGGLIYFNNGKSRSSLYGSPVYGPDPAIPFTETTAYTKQVSRLPVFGIVHRDAGVLAIIEEGEALANIRADIARDSNPYNIAYAAFDVTPKASRRLDQHTQITVYQRRMYAGDIQVRYTFLGSDEADYSGLANRYREYLVDQGILSPRTTADVPFFLEVTGAISAIRPVLGVPVQVSLPLTTISQVEELVGLLVEGGVTQPQVRYSGWLKGGIEHVYPSKVHLNQSLGTKGDLARLNNTITKLGGAFYPEVNFLEVYKTGPFDGFFAKRDATRAITGLVAQIHPYDPVLLQQDTTVGHYLLGPSQLVNVVDRFLEDYYRYDLTGISLSQFGSSVYSDFRGNEEKVVDRQETKEIVEEQLAKLAGSQKKVLIDGGNLFALPYVNGILQTPLWSTNYSLVDEEVPFFPMVVRGYVDYAGSPLNLSADWRRDVLRAVECGSGIYFSWVYEHAEQIKGTRFAYLYDVSYEHWLEQALAIYQQMHEALQGLQGQPITEHSKLGSNVFRTSFANGDALIVNYNDMQVEVDGIVVESLGFRRVEGRKDK